MSGRKSILRARTDATAGMFSRLAAVRRKSKSVLRACAHLALNGRGFPVREWTVFSMAGLLVIGAGFAEQHHVRRRTRTSPTFRVNSDLVLIRVSVVDSSNRPVLGLTRDRFHVFDNGVRQEIKSFGTDDDPVSLGFVFDASSSMRTVLSKSRQAVSQVCRWADPQDEYFLVTFAKRASLEVNFTSNCGDIQDRLLWVPALGDTSLIDGTYLSFQKLRHARHAHKALILVSDGGENASRYSAEELKDLAMESDAQLYAVGIGSFEPDGPVEEEEGPELLFDLARSTGGRYFAAGRAQDLPEISRQIADELRNEYVVGYSASDLSRPGEYHSVSIKITRTRGQPKYSTFWKREYYLPKE